MDLYHLIDTFVASVDQCYLCVASFGVASVLLPLREFCSKADAVGSLLALLRGSRSFASRQNCTVNIIYFILHLRFKYVEFGPR